MTTKERIEIWAIIALEMIAILGGVYGIISWSKWRDQRLMQAAEAYEECIAREYNTTPSAYRVENGQYPVCNGK